MDDAMRDRVVAELRRNGYEGSDAELRRLAEKTMAGQAEALRIGVADLYKEFTRATWPGRLLVRVADVLSRALARWAAR